MNIIQKLFRNNKDSTNSIKNKLNNLITSFIAIKNYFEIYKITGDYNLAIRV